MHIVRGIFCRAIAGVRHVTISAGDARIVVGGASGEEFIFRMLRLEHGRIGFGIFPIFESNFFVVGNDLFNLCAVVPREGQIFAIAFEIIFNVAVGANHGPHFLAGEGCPILALASKASLSAGLVTIRRMVPASWQLAQPIGVVDVRRHFIEGHLVICFHAHSVPQARVVR